MTMIAIFGSNSTGHLLHPRRGYVPLPANKHKAKHYHLREPRTATVYRNSAECYEAHFWYSVRRSRCTVDPAQYDTRRQGLKSSVLTGYFIARPLMDRGPQEGPKANNSTGLTRFVVCTSRSDGPFTVCCDPLVIASKRQYSSLLYVTDVQKTSVLPLNERCV